MNLENKHNNQLERLGFSFERGGVHTARTMMLAELRALLSFVDAADAAKADYLDAIQTANCLGKRSGRTRLHRLVPNTPQVVDLSRSLRHRNVVTDQSTKYLTHALRRNDEARRTISFS